MAILDSIKSFLISHESLLKEIEAMTIAEAISLVKTLYPNDPVLIDIISKIAAEIEKLQGIQQQ